jgi:hypothetical protein
MIYLDYVTFETELIVVGRPLFSVDYTSEDVYAKGF